MVPAAAHVRAAMMYRGRPTANYAAQSRYFAQPSPVSLIQGPAVLRG